ncbi:MAG TPA: AraC family transcriptional regulator [Clostridiales bacterium]|nr:AraC family transcriptional regulator [Clostridiales bacterium]
MLIYRDNIILDKDFPFAINQVQLKKADNCRDSFHWHSCCEISYVESGSGSYFVNGRQYEMEAGDMIIFNHVEPHGWLVESEEMLMTVMVFSTELVSNLNYDYLKPFVERGSNFKNKIDREELLTSDIVHMVKEIYNEHQAQKQGHRLLILADMLRILTLLIRYYQKDLEPGRTTETLTDKKYNMKRLEEAFHYINSHYTEKITLKEVAESVFMSENYFSFYFKKITDTSFMDYVTGLRLKRVNELMKTTDMSMYEIAMESGFHNMANFYRIYKKHVGALPTRRRE